MSKNKNTMYVCQCCAYRFCNPDFIKQKTGVTWDDNGQEETETVLCCPVCGMSELINVGVCDICGENMDVDGGDICDNCREDVRRKFREFMKTLSPLETSCLDELLDGTSVVEV